MESRINFLISRVKAARTKNRSSYYYSGRDPKAYEIVVNQLKEILRLNLIADEEQDIQCLFTNNYEDLSSYEGIMEIQSNKIMKLLYALDKQNGRRIITKKEILRVLNQILPSDIVNYCISEYI